ncbi:hypothetical protein RJ639_028290 [Escallonia herrerae]|uniref:Cytochrome P450 n=1 Tax=Escallonia herrerae TaxID=1293975 RepID=A0AA88X4S8_9ASTE|nr:hypothetical protein RJ639_028290 [Escallonia herrerae]
MSCLLALKDENEDAIPEEMIVDNFITLMIASHDTSAILLSLMVWKLSKEPEIYRKVFWTSYGTHMNKDIFDNPTEFDPTRFENLSKPIPPYAYIPFGGGLHSCIGNEFTRVETLTTIHRLVTMYESMVTVAL